MITWTKRLLLTFTILGLLATNVLTLTSAALNAALSGFISTALGVATVTEALQPKIARQRTAAKTRKVAARKFGTRLAARTKRVAAASVAAIPAETIPFLGVGVLVAGTAYELYEACESMKAGADSGWIYRRRLANNTGHHGTAVHASRYELWRLS